MKRLITSSELVGKTEFELTALYEQVRLELEHVEPDSYEHDILSASLANIRRAFFAAQIKPPRM